MVEANLSPALHNVAVAAIGARLNVMDVTGRVVLHPQWHDGRTGFDATDLPNGAYLLQVTTASGVPIAHGRWVKN